MGGWVVYLERVAAEGHSIQLIDDSRGDGNGVELQEGKVLYPMERVGGWVGG